MPSLEKPADDILVSGKTKVRLLGDRTISALIIVSYC